MQNLRIAAAKLNGIEVKANAVFSFWRHIGYPSKWNGFVVGREIREGCIVPTIAGGLCQLSNALYDAALKAGFEIVERHAHTRIIKGSLAESGRDATVKWNYVDHIVIAQNLLPFAWEQGLLGGRTFDVLMTRLPMEILQQKLDDAHCIHPESKTLDDFRAGASLIAIENTALTHASRIITPHHEIAAIFNNKSTKLDWYLPKASGKHYSGDKILFPASALARKGAYEMRQLAKELSLKLVITGNATEMDGFWQDASVSIAEGGVFKDIALVVLPSYIEHQPRLLLKALANHIPVIATNVCGIPASNDLTIIPAGDYNALKAAVISVLNKRIPNAEAFHAHARTM